jgi:hypothetical protein
MASVKCYKVVQSDLQSTRVTGRAKVQYVIGEYAEAPAYLKQLGLHPTAFLHLKDARKFVKKFQYLYEEPLKIFTAYGSVAVNKFTLIQCLNVFDLTLDKYLKSVDFWKTNPGGEFAQIAKMFKRVKLLKEVK